jgi:proteasome accessory factor B
MAHEKTQLRRLTYIHQELMRDRFPNCSSMAWELEVSTKTIQRDLDFLRDECGAPIEYDRQKHGYYYTEKNYKMGVVDISEGDFFAMCVAEKVLTCYQNTPVYEKLRGVFGKIEASLPESVAVRPDYLDTAVSVVPRPSTVIDPRVFDTLCKAIQDSRRVDLVRRPEGRRKTMRRELDPYQLIHYDGEWYVKGYDRLREDIRTFAVSRIESATIRDEQVDVPADYDFALEAGHFLDHFWGPEAHKVSIEFSAAAAPYILEREWHPSQKIKKNRDGSIVLTIEVRHLFEVQRWVLSYGAEARVLEPAELVKQVGTALRQAARQYGK